MLYDEDSVSKYTKTCLHGTAERTRRGVLYILWSTGTMVALSSFRITGGLTMTFEVVAWSKIDDLHLDLQLDGRCRADGRHSQQNIFTHQVV